MNKIRWAGFATLVVGVIVLIAVILSLFLGQASPYTVPPFGLPLEEFALFLVLIGIFLLVFS